MNIHYIRAAIEANTGIRLKLKEVRDILVEEGLLSKQKAKHIIFRGYGEFYDYFYKHDKNVVEATHSFSTPLDTYSYMEALNGEKEI